MNLPLDLLSTLRSLDVDTVVDSLSRLYLRQREAQRLAADDEISVGYEKARRLLRDREERLSAERSLVQETLRQLLAQSAPARTAAPRDIAVAGPPGGRASGEFELRNTLPRAADFELVAGLRDDGTAAPVTFTPGRPHLGAGEAVAVSVAVDLAATRAGEEWTVPVHVLEGGGRIRQQLTLAVTCSGPGARHGDARHGDARHDND
ncbi:MAG TPA: hypothetical protein VIF57_06685 [Polyangia bacterium]